MKNYNALTRIIRDSSAGASSEWGRLQGRLRPLFDEDAHEWSSIEMAEKIRILRAFDDAMVDERTTVLDLVLTYYFNHYGRTMPHVLVGFTSAMRRYQEEGFDLTVPREIDPNSLRGTSGVDQQSYRFVGFD